MANTIRIKRRATGNAGAPSSLENAELAFNEVDDVLYYGKGTGGAGGTATSVIAIGGTGSFVSLSGAQTITGNKTFTGTTIVPEPSANTHAATKLYVDNAVSGATVSSEQVQDIVGAMVGTNTESGIAVTYDDDNGKLNFDVDDFTITLGGDLTGSVTVSNLANATLNATVAANSVALGTDTTGDYVGSVAAGTGITLSNTGTEGGTFTVTNAGVTSLAGTENQIAVSGASGSVTLSLAANVTTPGNLTVTGDLTVQGNTTTLNTSTLIVEDKNIVLANVATPTDITADGAGISILGDTTKTFNWVDATNAFTSSEHIDLAAGRSYHIGGTSVLSNTTLGSTVLNSSLTSVGTITSGTWNGTAIAVANGGTGATDASTARTNLGLAIGVNVQAYDPELAAIAGLVSAADSLPYFTGANTAALATFTTFGRSLIDDADAAAGRTTLGLGTISTQNSNNVSITGGSISSITLDLVSIDGGSF